MHYYALRMLVLAVVFFENFSQKTLALWPFVLVSLLIILILLDLILRLLWKNKKLVHKSGSIDCQKLVELTLLLIDDRVSDVLLYLID